MFQDLGRPPMGEDELRRLLEFVPDAMLLVREDGTFVLANRQAEKLLGYTQHELARLSVEKLVPERFRDRHAEHRERFRGRRRATDGKSPRTLRGLQGRPRIARRHQPRPRGDFQGQVVAAILRDVSRHKQAEWDLSARAGGSATTHGAAQGRECLSPRGNPQHPRLRRTGWQSDALRLTLRQIEQVANTDANVLIVGETGTGKELVARAIHERSARKSHVLIKVDCAALAGQSDRKRAIWISAGRFYRGVGAEDRPLHGGQRRYDLSG